jgi:hypothetical protein
MNNGCLQFKDIIKNSTPYLLMNDECSPVNLLNLTPDRQIYANGTWRIYTLKSSTKQNSSFKPALDKNFLQTLKDHIKKI